MSARPFLLIIASVLIVASSAPAEDMIDFTSLETIATEELASSKIPGCVIVVVQGDRVAFATGLGVANIETGERLTPDHLFRIGSTTKMFVGATLTRLAEADKLKLNDPIGRVIDGLPPGLSGISTHQLLTHTAGLIDEAPMFGRQDEAALGEGILAWNDQRLFTRPGDIWSYSNPGYWLAGYVAERVAGNPFADVVHAELLRPLKMSRTTFRPTMAMTFPLAQGHESREKTSKIIRPAANNAATWPAGSLYSSGNDLARFVIAMLNRGQLDGQSVMTESFIKQMTTPHAAIPGGRHYGYGLMIEKTRGVPTWRHAGARSGYGSSILFAPEQRVGLIILTNRTAGMLPRTIAKAEELLLPRGPNEVPSVEIPPPEKIAELAGRYHNGTFSIELTWTDNKLMRSAPGKDRALTPVGGMRFLDGAEVIEFVRGADGESKYLFSRGHALRRIENP